MIKTDKQNLFVTKTGWFSYYRRIPKSIVHLHEFKDYKTFYRKSLNTKDRTLAELETDKRDKWFDQLQGNSVKPKLTKEKIRKVKDELRIQDLLKQRIDTEDLDEFLASKEADRKYWQEVADSQKEWLASWQEGEAPALPTEKPVSTSKAYDQDQRRLEEVYRLTDAIADKYDDGQGGYKKADPYDEDIIRLRLLTGEIEVDLEPTFGDAVDTYINDYNQNKPTNENQRSKWIKEIESNSRRIAEGLTKGLATPLSELDRDEIQAVAEKIWPNANTRNTALSGRMVPVINTWNKLNPRKKLDHNPFASLVGQKAIKESTKTRRPVTPEEYQRYWSNLEACDDPEIRMIGMMIAYCGAPQGETAGMLRGDLKLKDNTPHLLIRENSLRILAKKRLERVIPLLDPIIEHWRDYIENHFTGGRNDPLFPRYGSGRYAPSARAKKLSKMIDNQLGGDDILTSYSLRHAFKDRYIAAGVSEGVGQYLMGHNTQASSEVHKNYGGLTEPHRFLDDMTKIAKVVDFGYIERFDDD